MDTPSAIAEHLLALLERAIADRGEGLALLRCREGLRHGFWLERGFVVGAHVAGHFDPLLERLRQRGALDERGHHACLRTLRESDRRAGSLALEHGVDRRLVRDALRSQLVERGRALFALARSQGHEVAFEARPVPEREWCVRMPLGSLLRGIADPGDRLEDADTRRERRRELRALARALHPDLHGHRGQEAQRACEEQLARATAAYHGFVRVA